jgi:hypothetical protein
MACRLPLKRWPGQYQFRQQNYRTNMTSSQRRAPLSAVAFIAGLLLVAGALPLMAQPNFSFRMGAASVLLDNAQAFAGVSVGSVGKFDVFPLMRFRVQVDVDKVRMENMTSQYIRGDQSATFVCMGIGVETAIGNKDLYFFGNLIPHGTFRTTAHRAGNDADPTAITDVTRFSLGVALGIGGEVFITDHLGIEGLMQYDIYNMDPYDTEPRYRAIRATVGLQFYLGSNFKR